MPGNRGGSNFIFPEFDSACCGTPLQYLQDAWDALTPEQHMAAYTLRSVPDISDIYLYDAEYILESTIKSPIFIVGIYSSNRYFCEHFSFTVAQPHMYR